MKNNKILLILLVAFVILLAGAAILYNNLSDQYNPAPLVTQTTTPSTSSSDETPEATTSTAPMAPNFTVTDANGNTVDLYDFLGKPIVLNFWASWCGPCRSEMPEIEAAYQSYGNDIHFLIVNLTDGDRETTEAAASYITGAGYTFPIYFDTTLNAAVAYSAYSIPATYFIGSDGRPVARYAGAMSADILQQGIDLLIGE